jgi:hypothetical protein
MQIKLCSALNKALKKLAKWSSMLLIALPAIALAEDAARVVFVSGNVLAEGKVATLDSMVQEGASIKTGADGYVYLKTVDAGFLILRPNSEARIVNYHVDKVDPTKTRIKLELISGVARSISGDAVKLARQNFRFNTPVAAIGVRGTDFTVYTTQDTSRVAVISGGVIMSGFNATCAPQGNGPCEGVGTAELFANQHGKLLQMNKNQAKPQLLNGSALSPDVTSPPRPDEPGNKANTNNSPIADSVPLVTVAPVLNPVKDGTLTTPVVTPPVVTPPVVTPPEVIASTIIWGRWVEVIGQGVQINVKDQADAGAKVVAINNYYALFQAKNAEWQVPESGSIGFSLKDSQAVVFDEVKRSLSTAGIENASLRLDFAKASFSTAFDLTTGTERFALQAQGSVSSDGMLSGVCQYCRPTNMDVQGFVSDKGTTAAYLFQSRLDDNRLASGVTYWTK